METISFRITGNPRYGLLMHNPAGMGKAKPGVIVKTIPTPEAEAEAAAYRNEDKSLYVPARAFRGTILNAVKGRKIGKTTAWQVFSSSLFVDAERCPLIKPSSNGKKVPITEYRIDTQRAVVQRQGVMRSRPLIDAWACEVTFEYEPERLSPDHIEQALVLAGETVGILDYRPATKGPYGRFSVERL